MQSSISNQTPVKELVRIRTREFIDATHSGDYVDLRPSMCSQPILFYIYFGEIDLYGAQCTRDAPDVMSSEESEPIINILSLMKNKMTSSSEKTITFIDDPVPGKLYWATLWLPTEGLSLSYKNADNVHGRYDESNFSSLSEKEYAALYSVETGFILFGSAERPPKGIVASLTLDDVSRYQLGTVE